MTDVAYEILADLVKDYAVQVTRKHNNEWVTWYRLEGNMDGAMARAFALLVGVGMAEWTTEKCIKFIEVTQ